MILILLSILVPVYSGDVNQQELDPPPGCGVYHQNFTIAPQWERLFSAGKNLTILYKHPSRGYGPGHEMVRTAHIFLEELEKLENEFTVENRVPATDAAWELYICGGPLHIRQIPYDEFVRLFNWDSTDIDEYATIIDDTRRSWSNILEELERIAPTDIII